MAFLDLEVFNENKNLLFIKNFDNEGYSFIKNYLTKYVNNYKFMPSYRNGRWDGKISLLINNFYIPVGLWNDILELNKIYNINININGLETLLDNIDKDEFNTYFINFFKDKSITPRDYQLETAYNFLVYKKASAELATSAGKTLVLFLVLKYLYIKKKIQKAILIVPNIMLVHQIYNEFLKFNGEKENFFKMFKIFNFKNSKFKSTINDGLYIGTYQSLIKHPILETIDCVIIDEMHKIKAATIRSILETCIQSDYRIGLTGTFPKKDTLEYLVNIAYTGPIINKVLYKDLAAQGHIVKAQINAIILNYLNEDIKEKINTLDMDKQKVYRLMTKIYQASDKRLNTITNLALELKNNVVIFFKHIKYGRQIYDKLINNKNDKIILYLDGTVLDENRMYIKKIMEERDNIILVASYGVFSTGVDIKNIYNLIFAESYKSDVVVRQSIGRGLRKKEGKDKVILIDIIDFFNVKNSYELFYKHYIRYRKPIYLHQGFQLKEVKLTI